MPEANGKLGYLAEYLAALFWEVRIPTVRYACGQQWLSQTTCGALLPSELANPEAPAPKAPAPAKP